MAPWLHLLPLAFPRPSPPPLTTATTTAAALRLIIAVQLRPPLCLPVGLSAFVMGAATTLARVGWAVLSAPCHAVLPTRRQFNVRGKIGGCFLVASRCSSLRRSGATLSFYVVLFGLRAQKAGIAACKLAGDCPFSGGMRSENCCR